MQAARAEKVPSTGPAGGAIADNGLAGLSGHLRAPGGHDAEGVVSELVSAFGILGSGGDGNRAGDGAGVNRPTAGHDQQRPAEHLSRLDHDTLIAHLSYWRWVTHTNSANRARN